MAHKEQIEYCREVKALYPEYFEGVYVLDAGSLDINGNNQYLFANSSYMGVDIGEGKNVDIVSKIHQLQLPDNTFDTIISTEVFEHDKYYADSIKNIYRMLKPGGMFLFTCATTGRPEHGTKKTTPKDAPLLQDDEEWQDYYKNLTEADIKEVFDLERYFCKHQFMVDNQSHDLYFWGIKNGIWKKRSDRSFHIDDHIQKISTKYFIQLFIDQGNGYSEENSIRLPVAHNTESQEFIFDLSGTQNIRALRLDPLNDYVVLEIGSLCINNQEYSNHLKTNAFCVEEEKYYFFTKDSNIFLDMSGFESVCEVKFRLKYLSVGEDVLSQFSDFFSKKLTSKDQEIEGLKQHTESLMKELTLIYTSTSWRITRLMRRLKRLLKAPINDHKPD